MSETLEADARLIRQVRAAPELYEALVGLVAIIRAAGVSNLSNGVQLGQISWAVKANDRLEVADDAIAKAEGRS